MKNCAWCGALMGNGLGKDRRYKYCSDECAKEAHRANCRERFRVRYATKHEQELERYRRYWQTHKAEKTAYIRAWQKNNREAYNAYSRKYYQRRKEKLNENL